MSESKRKRLTITLRKDLLKQVDRSVDGSKVRNRSHANGGRFQYLLIKPTTLP